MTGTLFHAADPTDMVFCHNIGILKGRLTAVSMLRAANPELSGARSPYEAFTREADKEAVFEEVRRRDFPSAPSRMGALFFFASQADADAANAAWWRGQRVILRAQIVGAAGVGCFDARHLDAARDNWEAAARLYWAGERTTSPRLEVIVNGVAQLTGWEGLAVKFRPSERKA